MKIVQINAIYGSKSTGTIAQDIAECCKRNGIKPYAVYSIGPRFESTDGIRIGNVFVEKWHALLSRIGGKQAYFSRITTSRFLKTLDKIKPDIVHLHNLHSNYIHLNMLLRYLADRNIATVITMHDCWYFTGGCTHYTAVGCFKWQKGCGKCPQRCDIKAYLFDSTAKILADRRKYLTSIPRLVLVGASEWIANEAKKSLLSSVNITYIHNGFDFDVFKPCSSTLRRDLGIDNKKMILGPASKWLSPVNKFTLDYFVSHMDESTVLVLFGCTDMSLVLPSNVMLLGYTNSRQEMAELYSAADVFVNCTIEDTLSSINIECQACGTPVVTYDSTGNKETVDFQRGFTVKSGDAESLWNRTKEVLKFGKSSYSNMCQDFVRQNFSKNNYLQYIELYKDLMSNREL